MSYRYEFPRANVTLDLIVLRPRAGRVEALLIRRGHDPFRGMWAIPGGFLEMDEELEAGARRELREETGLDVDGVVELGVYGKVGRDPRGRCITVTFLALDLDGQYRATAGDDAADAQWKSLARPGPLAFDHADMLRDARNYLKRAVEDVELLLPLLPRRFVLSSVQALFAAERAPVARETLRRRLQATGLVRVRGTRGREALFETRARARR